MVSRDQEYEAGFAGTDNSSFNSPISVCLLNIPKYQRSFISVSNSLKSMWVTGYLRRLWTDVSWQQMASCQNEEQPTVFKALKMFEKEGQREECCSSLQDCSNTVLTSVSCRSLKVLARVKTQSASFPPFLFSLAAANFLSLHVASRHKEENLNRRKNVLWIIGN